MEFIILNLYIYLYEFVFMCKRFMQYRCTVPHFATRCLPLRSFNIFIDPFKRTMYTIYISLLTILFYFV